MNNQFESTYSLLIRSEEKGRGVVEVSVYAACFLSVVFSIWQFAQTSVTAPAPGTKPCVACHTTTSEFRAGTWCLGLFLRISSGGPLAALFSGLLA